MKKYIKPASDIVLVATDEFMEIGGMSIRIFDGDFSTSDGEELLIKDGSEVLNNENYVWDKLENDL